MKVLKCNPNRSDCIAARVTRENVQEVKLWCNAEAYTVDYAHDMVLFRINWLLGTVQLAEAASP